MRCTSRSWLAGLKRGFDCAEGSPLPYADPGCSGEGFSRMIIKRQEKKFLSLTLFVGKLNIMPGDRCRRNSAARGRQ